jgi:transcriptional regulator with XRE-family HTH domain
MQNTKEDRVRLGARMRAARVRAHISVQDAAVSLGVQPIAIDRWERGLAMPSLVDFTRILPVYGVMACELLFERNPLELPPDQAAELAQAAKQFSPGLRTRVDCLLAMLARGREPEWRKVA